MTHYNDWFRSLDELLYQGQPWWKVKPFHCLDYPWANTDLKNALDSLSDDEVTSLDADELRLAQWLEPWIESASSLLQFSQLPNFPHRELTIPERIDHQVPGRKWQQVCAFVKARPKTNSKAPNLLEWCSGKGHLGRLMSIVDRCTVQSLEWQHELCKSGRQLSSRHEVDQSFVCADAFSETARNLFNNQTHAVALHACGDLHTTLMRHWSQRDGRSLTISPCCYHLIQGNNYQPLSKLAAGAKTRLSKDDLSLPLQKTVTAGATVRRRRDLELQWRMAFDLWQRDWRGVNEYLPVATIRADQLKGSFFAFVSELADKNGLDKPDAIEERHWLDLGLKRTRKVRRMELITHLYRRPLEIWLALDRVLYLQEGGAKVELGQFCDEQLSPRNIMIHATAGECKTAG